MEVVLETPDGNKDLQLRRLDLGGVWILVSNRHEREGHILSRSIQPVAILSSAPDLDHAP